MDKSIIFKGIRDKFDESSLDAIIQNYLINTSPGVTVEQWRLQHYKDLRRHAYPPVEDYLDSQLKLADTDIEEQSQGQQQFDQWVSDCKVVKTRFPKKQIQVTPIK